MVAGAFGLQGVGVYAEIWDCMASAVQGLQTLTNHLTVEVEDKYSAFKRTIVYL